MLHVIAFVARPDDEAVPLNGLLHFAAGRPDVGQAGLIFEKIAEIKEIDIVGAIVGLGLETALHDLLP